MRLKGVKSVPSERLAVAPLLAEWSRERPYSGDERDPAAIGASRLGGCTRALAYNLARVKPTDPMGEAGLHATGIGSLVHDAIQQRLQTRPGYAVEVPWRIEVEVEGSDRPVVIDSAADYAEFEAPLPRCSHGGDCEWPDHPAAVHGDIPTGRLPDGLDAPKELGDMKTMAPFGLRMKVTKEGPDRGALIQVGLAMKALGATGPESVGRVVAIASAELKGHDRIEKDGGANDYRENRYHEWEFPYSAVEPLVEDELRRVAKVRRYLDEGREVPRIIPGVTPPGAVVTDPLVGVWQEWVRPTETDENGGEYDSAEPVLVEQGSTWRCRYCPWQTRCVDDIEAGAGAIEVEL